MSTRQERQSNKTQNDMHLQILKELVSRPENKKCADCKKKDSRWVSINLGVFVCIRCSGIHRSIGVHITKIRSIDLDTFTPEQIQEVSKWGNAKANYYWEASLPAGHEPNES
ncbi:Arf GTPase activating protein domain-containing protein [Rozella allomycis CSF55]|uniref:Arf GTPase activating protein domain-containing protein n=1 Tax=Rozella allomycis (strain CSF55) TaxID=988480 RepID=A0A075ASY1_ROZAC|nr:Arf GTPase activating protein domain-containing protein [Rozella allomycis CSF55]|eukprot:EPZ31835.1 Arf GTPase activating protein domain-containing protein [Rozella allomycis CSF55]